MSEPTLADLTNDDFRWPRRGDRLFQEATTWWDSAEIHCEAGARTYFMVSGYKLAGDRLADIAISDHADRHDLIYPIVFCYRQFIELSLKSQIEEYGSWAGISPPKHHHDFKSLLRTYRKMCRAFHPNNDEVIIVVSKCILEFARMDPNSFTFRYVKGKDGKPYPVSTDRIDLARLKDVMNGLGGFFTGADGYFSEVVSYQPDIEGY